MTSKQNISNRQLWLISISLAVLTAAAFEPVRFNAFVDFDDNTYIVTNHYIQAGLTQDSIRWAFSSSYASNWHPLTWLSHILDIELFGLHPLGHHLHSLVLHILSTVILFWLLYKMTGSVWCSAFAAMTFGIHPLRAESVAWAAERKDVLSVLLSMLTLAAYLYYVHKGGVWRYLFIVLFFSLGLMAKPMLVTIPILLLILDIWPLKRNLQISAVRLAAEKIPFFILSAASCIITYKVQQSGGSMAPKVLSLLPRLSNSLSSYADYLGKIAWPSDLAVLYPYQDNLPLWKPITALLIMTLVSSFVLYRFSKQPYLAAGWFWYLVSLIPVIGLVQVGSQSMADRYTYLPSVGIFIMLSWGMADLLAGWRYHRVICPVLIVTAAAAMTTATRLQVSRWQNSVALFEHTLAVTQNNHIIHHSLGWVFARQDKFESAADHLNKALQLWPEFPEANLDMAGLLIKHKKYDQAMTYLNRVLENTPDNAIAYCNLGIIFETQEKINEAIAAYAKAVHLDGDNYEAWNALGILKAKCGLLSEAKDCFYQCNKINLNYAEGWRNLGFTLQMENNLTEAISCYRKALEKEPDSYQTFCNLAQALQMTGNPQGAADACRHALQLKPDLPEAMNNLAWLLATTADNSIHNPAEAIDLAQKACEMTAYKDTDNLDTLAAAYAANGQFNEATETAQKAIQLALGAQQDIKAKEISERLRLYQAGKPYIFIQEQ